MNKEQRGWNNLNNEGGEGYVPATKAEMAQIEAELAALKVRNAMTQAEKDAENNARQDDYLAKEKEERDTDVRVIAYLARQKLELEGGQVYD